MVYLIPTAKETFVYTTLFGWIYESLFRVYTSYTTFTHKCNKMKKLYLIIILFPFIFNAQNEKLQREAFTLNLTEENGNSFRKEIPMSSYLIGKGILEIYPTEKINLEIEVRNDNIYSKKIVNKITKPKQTITVYFYQNVTKMETRLNVYNPFKRYILKYDAEIFLLKREKWVVGEVLQVEPKKEVSEVWVNTMSAAKLWNWKLIKT